MRWQRRRRIRTGPEVNHELQRTLELARPGHRGRRRGASGVADELDLGRRVCPRGRDRDRPCSGSRTLDESSAAPFGISIWQYNCTREGISILLLLAPTGDDQPPSDCRLCCGAHDRQPALMLPGRPVVTACHRASTNFGLATRRGHQRATPRTASEPHRSKPASWHALAYPFEPEEPGANHDQDRSSPRAADSR